MIYTRARSTRAQHVSAKVRAHPPTQPRPHAPIHLPIHHPHPHLPKAKRPTYLQTSNPTSPQASRTRSGRLWTSTSSASRRATTGAGTTAAARTLSATTSAHAALVRTAALLSGAASTMATAIEGAWPSSPTTRPPEHSQPAPIDTGIRKSIDFTASLRPFTQSGAARRHAAFVARPAPVHWPLSSLGLPSRGCLPLQQRAPHELLAKPFASRSLNPSVLGKTRYLRLRRGPSGPHLYSWYTLIINNKRLWLASSEGMHYVTEPRVSRTAPRAAYSTIAPPSSLSFGSRHTPILRNSK